MFRTNDTELTRKYPECTFTVFRELQIAGDAAFRSDLSRWRPLVSVLQGSALPDQAEKLKKGRKLYWDHQPGRALTKSVLSIVGRHQFTDTRN